MLANMNSMGVFLKCYTQELEFTPTSSPTLSRRFSVAMPVDKAPTPSSPAQSVQLGSSPPTGQTMDGRPRRSSSMGEYFSWLVKPNPSVSKRDLNVFAPVST